MKLCKLIAVLSISLMLIACGEKEGEPSEGANMGNPMVEAGVDEIIELTGADIEIPADAENVQGFIYNGEFGEIQYTVNDGTVNVNIRTKRTEEFEDISGDYYEWTEEKEGTLGKCTEIRYEAEDGDNTIQLCLWYDQDKKIMYSADAIAADMGGFEILDAASKVYTAD